MALRVGFHVGPVIGGVIGRERPTYDYWGDTLNIASRLEATGEPGFVHCSEAVYWRLRGSWSFEPRGPIELKGYTKVETYYLLARPRLCEPGGSGIKTPENDLCDTCKSCLPPWGFALPTPSKKQTFQAEHAATVLTRQRVLIGFALMVFLAYAVRDIAIGPTFGYGALYLRIFFILPILGLSFVLTFAESVRPHFQTMFVSLLVIVIAAIGMLSLLYPHYGPTDPAQANRTMSSMMLTLAIMTIAGLRFENAIAVGVVAVLFWFFGSLAKELGAGALSDAVPQRA